MFFAKCLMLFPVRRNALTNPHCFSRNSCEFYCRCVPASEGLTLGNCYLKKAAGYILLNFRLKHKVGFPDGLVA